MRIILAALATAIVFSGCAAVPKRLEPGWKPGVIAILPFTNQSADVALEKFARLVMIEKVKAANFQVIDAATVDARLEELGVTEGGQLSTLAPQELADAIGADSYLYGDIIDAKRVLLGVYLQKKVQIEFKILDREGRTKWEDERISAETKVVLSPAAMLATAAAQFATSMTGDLVMKSLKSHPLIAHLQAVCTWSASTLPRP